MAIMLATLMMAFVLNSYLSSNDKTCSTDFSDKEGNPIYSCPNKNGAELQVVVNGKIIRLQNDKK